MSSTTRRWTAWRRIVAVLASLALVLSMSFGTAGLAFADGGTGTSVTVGDTTGTFIGASQTSFSTTVGASTQLNLGDYVSFGPDGYHVDYKVTGSYDTTGTATSSTIATVNKHTGIVSASAAGSVTVTAYLIPFAKSLCSSDVDSAALAGSYKVDLTITINQASPTAYGYQGNTLQILVNEPSGTTVTSGSNSTGWVNAFASSPVDDSGNLNVEFTMNYGTGNNIASAFTSLNSGKIMLTDENGNSSVMGSTDDETAYHLSLAYSDTQATTLSVMTNESLEAGSYTLTFLPTFRAGNASKTLGCNVSFTFEVGE